MNGGAAMRVPKELLEHVFGFCSPDHAVSVCRRVCLLWSKVLIHSTVVRFSRGSVLKFLPCFVLGGLRKISCIIRGCSKIDVPQVLIETVARECSRLEMLEIEQPVHRYWSADLVSLRNLLNLEHLTLGNVDSNVTGFELLTQVKHFTLNGCKLGPRFDFKNLPGVVSIFLSQRTNDNSRLDLQGLPNLETVRVRFGRCPLLAGHSLRTLTLTNLAVVEDACLNQCLNLRVLNFTFSGVTDNKIREFAARIPKLVQCCFEGSQVTGLPQDLIQSWTELVYLNMSYTLIQDKCIFAIRILPGLQTLVIGSPFVTNTCIVVLVASGFPKLKSLSLLCTPGISEIRCLATSSTLQDLCVYECENITAQEFAYFKTLAPSIRVDENFNYQFFDA